LTRLLSARPVSSSLRPSLSPAAAASASNGEIIIADEEFTRSDVARKLQQRPSNEHKSEIHKSGGIVHFTRTGPGRVAWKFIAAMRHPEMSFVFAATASPPGMAGCLQNRTTSPRPTASCSSQVRPAAGKTTTLNYMVDLINSARAQIVTSRTREFVHEKQAPPLSVS